MTYQTLKLGFAVSVLLFFTGCETIPTPESKPKVAIGNALRPNFAAEGLRRTGRCLPERLPGIVFGPMGEQRLRAGNDFVTTV